MRMFFCLVVFSLFLSRQAVSGGLPFPVSSAEQVSLEGMVWNKWETENFIVLSIDRGFGKSLASSVEGIRSDFCRSWGVSAKPLPVKCKLVCVPDQSVLRRFFSLEFPKCETRTSSGSTTEIAIWLDQVRSHELPGLIASACLHDRAPFLKGGVPAIISLSPSEISEFILSSDSAASAFSDDQERKTVQGSDIVACLFFRNEFGLLKFSEIVLDNGRSPQSTCGYPSKEMLEGAMARYLDNLKSDLKSGKTPDVYLKR